MSVIVYLDINGNLPDRNIVMPYIRTVQMLVAAHLIIQRREKRGWKAPIQDKKLCVIKGWEVLMQVTNVLIAYFYNAKFLSLKLLIFKRAKDGTNSVDLLSICISILLHQR